MTVKLIQGDCLEEMQKLIDKGVKVDLVLTDPPYGKTNCKWDTIISFDEMWECINNLIKDTTPCLLFGTEPFSSHLRLSNLKNYKYDWIWNKEVGTAILNRKYQPLNDYEIISVFYKKAGQYYPIMRKIEKLRSFSVVKASKSNVYGQLKRDTNYEDSGFRFPKRIITVNCQKKECNNTNRFHPTQKPIELLEYLIRTDTKENDTILDFTMGSGSTGVACVNTNRNFIGIELDENYYNIAQERINETKKQTKLM